ncbi:hypothetical protein ACFLWY_03575 [Chloroflexota bacterium]
MSRRLIRIVISAAIFTSLLTSSVLAWNASNLTTIDQDEDEFYNYDFLDEEEGAVSDNVDWAVDIIYWYDASVEEAYHM